MLRLLLVLLLLPAPVLSADRPLVFTTVLPLKTFVERIGGGRVEVHSLVQPGQSPHGFEPSPRQVAQLSRADLYVRAGLGFEEAWMPRLRSVNRDMAVLDVRDGLPLRRLEDHDHGRDHDGPDPHVWTSPPLVKVMSAAIRDALIRLDPAQGDAYRAGHAAFAAELDTLDAELRALLAHVPSRRFMVYHPAWGYFADTYGLTELAIEREGKEPGAKALAGLIDQARREGVRVILVQPQMNPEAAEQVARAVGGTVATADPLAADYSDSLRRVARLIAGAGP